MKYKLYEHGTNNTGNVLYEVLQNRGIDNPKQYLQLTDDVVQDYNMLDNIEDAVQMLSKHLDSDKKIGVLIDEDVDGFCSAAMMGMYIKRLCQADIHYLMHKTAKAHGLTPDVDIPKNLDLLIIPDAGTNDVKEYTKLSKSGIDILILDHHEWDEKVHKDEITPDNVVIVNNQCSPNYKNKDLCGAGIVYRFMQAVDDELWEDYADEYLDLCALANISDVMDMRSYETKHLVDKGLKNIKNKLLQALIQAQDYSMNGKVTIHNVQWYLTPILNGCIRVGTIEEKMLLFEAFIEADKMFEYKKRATKNKPSQIVNESIYDRAVRLCKNAKAKQDRLRDKGLVFCDSVISSLDLTANKVIIIDGTDNIPNVLTGVTAIQVADKYNRPCLIINKRDNGIEDITYGGSGRNFNHSPIDSFKDIVNQTGIFNYARGHGNAFGFDINPQFITEANEQFNKLLKDVEYDATYKCDYILDAEDVETPLIKALTQFDELIGQGIDEPLIAIENIELNSKDISIFGKNEDTISFIIDDVKYIKFKCHSGEKLYDFLNDAWADESKITLNIIGKPKMNVYQGVKTLQVQIEDWEVTDISEIADNYDNTDEW